MSSDHQLRRVQAAAAQSGARPKAAYALKLPHSVKNAAQRLAAADSVSLNQFIAVAVAEKIGALESAEVFLKQRAGKAKSSDMKSILRRAPRGEVVASDQPA